MNQSVNEPGPKVGKMANEMKNQTISNSQGQFLVVAVAIAVILFVGSLGAVAQDAKYKVGDRVEAKVSGEWVKAEIRKLGDFGQIYVRHDGSSSDALTYADYIRPIKGDAQTGKRVDADGEVRNQAGKDQRAADAPKEASEGNKYGTRDPRTCKDKKAPAKGVITAAIAVMYVICEREKVSGPYLYLVENVKAEVGGGRPYNPNMDINFPEINVRFPVYPIRGSLVSYQCYEVNPNFTVSAPGKNCNRTSEPESKGFCYKTTFGEWRCHMTDFSNKNENWSQGVAPPKP